MRSSLKEMFCYYVVFFSSSSNYSYLTSFHDIPTVSKNIKKELFKVLNIQLKDKCSVFFPFL